MNTNTVFIDRDHKNETWIAMTESGCIGFSNSIDELKLFLIKQGYERVDALEWRLKDGKTQTL